MSNLASQNKVHIFGIRHHGPGSARSLRTALESLQPDVILVEGPADAQALLSLASHADMEPPVALLIYAPDRLEHAAYYPFAVFSPEWQALQFGLTQNIPVRLIDLPLSHQFALREVNKASDFDEISEPQEEASSEELPNRDRPTDRSENFSAQISLGDPLGWLAEAAGFSDGETWWEYMVEHRQDSNELFAAILEAIAVIRQEIELPEDELEKMREAYMRQAIRTAEAEGKQRIAVVCGAWHSPALSDRQNVKADTALLKGLPKLKVEATWVPWTYGRLAFSSGYGAGINSPGWYDHLWHTTDRIVIRWITKVARLLRSQDLDASSANVIEAVRLAESLAALRDRSLPALPELNEAIQTVLCFGDRLPMQLIHQQLIVGERLGTVPAETPMTPVQQDLIRQQKRLRLKPEALSKLLELDLRNQIDLERSHLLHRLRLLNIAWGKLQPSSGKGTFKESWQLQWQPEFAVSIVEAAGWGKTIAEAATGFIRHEAHQATDLPTLTELVDQTLLANLIDAAGFLIVRLQAEAAIAADVLHLMSALSPLANILRYGNVRQIDTNIVADVVDGLVVRICVGLPVACASLNDEAASTMFNLLIEVNRVILLLQNPEHLETWFQTLTQITDQVGLHGLLAGRCCRLLLDAGRFSAKEVGNHLGLALSTANPPDQAAAWVEGLLKGSGLVILHDDRLWQVIDTWVVGLNSETFTQILPLLRRTFSTFPAAERRQMGERVKQADSGIKISANSDRHVDSDRADAILPLITQLLGIN